MKLQGKITISLVFSLVLSALLSVAVINIFVFVFDKSYSKYDLDKIASEVSSKISVLSDVDEKSIMSIFDEYNKYKDVFYLSYIDFNRDFFLSTDLNRPHRPKEARNEIDRDEERFIREQRKNFRFINYFNPMDFVVRKRVVNDFQRQGVVEVSVKKEYLFPFYIRINNEKLPFLYLYVFLAFFVVITASYIFVLIFTIPIINRLKNLYGKINSFDLEKKSDPISDHGNDEIGVISRTFDEMTSKIVENYEEMKRFYQDRQELLKNISHDFRTPLTSILGYSVSLDEGVYESEAEQREYYKIIRKKAEYMSALFEEMMELTRLGNDTYVLRKDNFDFAELIRSIIIEYIPQLERAGFVIDTDLPESLNVLADRERLSRVVRNLIDNVIKHASQGKYIGFSLSSEGSFTILKVKDRGAGIDDGDKPRVFDRFFRVSKSGGMGLGLTIARDIIEKHGGSIRIEDNEAGGSVFVLRIL